MNYTNKGKFKEGNTAAKGTGKKKKTIFREKYGITKVENLKDDILELWVGILKDDVKLNDKDKAKFSTDVARYIMPIKKEYTNQEPMKIIVENFTE